MRKQQDIIDNKLEMKWTLLYVVHVVNICKTWDCQLYYSMVRH